jgi:hypothetical protein
VDGELHLVALTDVQCAPDLFGQRQLRPRPRRRNAYGQYPPSRTSGTGTVPELVRSRSPLQVRADLVPRCHLRPPRATSASVGFGLGIDAKTLIVPTSARLSPPPRSLQVRSKSCRSAISTIAVMAERNRPELRRTS